MLKVHSKIGYVEYVFTIIHDCEQTISNQTIV